MVLGATLTEGAGQRLDRQGRRGRPRNLRSPPGALLFAPFVLAMTAMRFFGGRAIDAYGRVAVLRASMAAAAAGLGLFVLAGNLWLATAGAALWGVGAALAFPMGMSAAADDPRHAAARVSVVSTIGYVAFLAGPPAAGLPGRRDRHQAGAAGDRGADSGVPCCSPAPRSPCAPGNGPQPNRTL